MAVEPAEKLIDYVAELRLRAEQIRNRAVRAEEDNMLKVSGDGRRAALDLRLVGLPQGTPGKIHAAANRIVAIWEAHRDDEYRAPDGTPTRSAGRSSWCSATWAPPARTGTSMTSCVTG